MAAYSLPESRCALIICSRTTQSRSFSAPGMPPWGEGGEGEGIRQARVSFWPMGQGQKAAGIVVA